MSTVDPQAPAPASPLTAKGRRTREQIVTAAADLIHRRGAGATTLLDVRRAAGVSSSQLYHYFADKQDLVHAVVDHQADTIVSGQQQRRLSSLEAFRSWRQALLADDMVRTGQGGCPLGSLGADLAENDPNGRAQVAAGFDRWAAAIEDGLRQMRNNGDLPAGTDTTALALGILAAVQGGLLLGQVHRDVAPLRAALDNTLALLQELTDKAHKETRSRID